MYDQLTIFNGCHSYPFVHNRVLSKFINLELWLTFVQVLTEEECVQLIKETEDIGYEPALLNIGGGNQRLETGVLVSQIVLVERIFSLPRSTASGIRNTPISV